MDNEGTRIHRLRRKVTLSGNINIANALELLQQLAPLLEAKTKVTLDLCAVQRIDTAILQLLLAFQRTASARGMPVTWSAPSDAVLDTAHRVGLSDSLGLEARNV